MSRARAQVIWVLPAMLVVLSPIGLWAAHLQLPALVGLGILALDAFVYMQALNPVGGPANSTVVISQHLLVTAFKKGKFGYATSMGATLALITLAFAALVFFVFWLTGEKKPPKATANPVRAPSAVSCPQVCLPMRLTASTFGRVRPS